jgi:hypothetical protein
MTDKNVTHLLTCRTRTALLPGDAFELVSAIHPLMSADFHTQSSTVAALQNYFVHNKLPTQDIFCGVSIVSFLKIV